MFHLTMVHGIATDQRIFRFDIDDDKAWEDVMQFIRLECTYSNEPIHISFGEEEAANE